MKAKHDQEIADLKKQLTDQALKGGTDGDGNGSDGGDVDVLVKYAEELDASVDKLKEFASDNEIDLSGLKVKADIQLAIGTWLHEQSNAE